MPPQLLREEILSKKTKTRVQVDVPEWEGSVYVHKLSAHEQYQLQRFKQDFPDTPESAFLVALATEDEEGKLVFPNPLDAHEIAKLDGDAIGRISLAILALHAGVEKLRKNS